MRINHLAIALVSSCTIAFTFDFKGTVAEILTVSMNVLYYI